MNPSQMPEEALPRPSGVSGCSPACQPLKSPITETREADGAQTAK